MKNEQKFEAIDRLKNRGIIICILGLILISFLPSLVEAKTAEEWFKEGGDL